MGMRKLVIGMLRYGIEKDKIDVGFDRESCVVGIKK